MALATTTIDVQGGVHVRQWIPIEYAQDGAVPPAAASTLSNGDGSVTVRDFDGTAVTEDVIFPWIATGVLPAKDVKYQILCAVTNATGPSGEGVYFEGNGGSSGDTDDIDVVPGADVATTSGVKTQNQYTLILLPLSAAMTITDLAKDELVMINIKRVYDDPLDTYGQDIGVLGIWIDYWQELGE